MAGLYYASLVRDLHAAGAARLAGFVTWADETGLLTPVNTLGSRETLTLAPGAITAFTAGADAAGLTVRGDSRFTGQLTDPVDRTLPISARVWTAEQALAAVCGTFARWDAIVRLVAEQAPGSGLLAAEIPHGVWPATSLQEAFDRERRTLSRTSMELLRNYVMHGALDAWRHGPLGTVPAAGVIGDTYAALVRDAKEDILGVVAVEAKSTTLKGIVNAARDRIGLLDTAVAVNTDAPAARVSVAVSRPVSRSVTD